MTTADGPTIGLDLGTSAIKGVLMAADGRILRTASRIMVYDQPTPERVECDANRHWRETAGLIRELAEAAPQPVRAIALSGASGNTLLADTAGKPLTPIINWMDRRGVGAALPALQGLTPEAVRRVTGWPCTDRFPLAHLAWMRAHDPARLDAAAHVCMNTDWLLFRLTGQWVMDYSTATTFHLQNQTGRRWHRPFLERLGLRETQLPRLAGSGVAVGPLTPEAAADTGLTTATLAVTGAFDHPSAARAAGITRPGQLLLSCGTSWVGLLPWTDRDALVEAALLCDPFLSDAGGPWAGMFSVSAIGPVIDAYVASLSAPGADRRAQLERFDALAASAPAGAEGLVIDLSAPFRPVDAPPALVARAVMEGAARALLAPLERLRARGFAFQQAVMVGGPGNSPVWPGIVAAITGLDLSVGTTHAGAAGAALLARLGAEKYRGSAGTGRTDGAGRTDRDREVYDRELRGFLPPRLFDVHVHLLDAGSRIPGTEYPPRSCYRKFGCTFTREQYLDWAAEWLPEQELHFNAFGHPGRETDRERAAAYAGRVSDNRRAFGMALVSPADPADQVARWIEEHHLVGYKPYLNYVEGKPADEVTLGDMLTEAQMAYADARGLAVMLHIPRPGRLADPVNQRDMVAFCRRYPRARIIFAHIGRAYYLSGVQGGLDGIAACPNAYIDTAMVNHEGVLEYAFRHFPRERILFGTDAPIACLRGKSVEINNQYAYLMGEEYEVGTSIFDARGAVKFTTFYYEQLRGIRLASERAGLTRAEVEDILFHNAHRLFTALGATIPQFSIWGPHPVGTEPDPPVP
jgi:sugar (pentulose or hexulose) kinase/predicted TIM-barrel fold metal-dependent hydrolase